MIERLAYGLHSNSVMNTMKDIMKKKRDNNNNHLTVQGLSYIEILVQDKITGEMLGSALIKRSELARHFNNSMVVGSQDNKFIVQF